MKWQVHNYGESGDEGWSVEVEADTKEEAIQKAPYDWRDPTRWGYGATPLPLASDLASPLPSAPLQER